MIVLSSDAWNHFEPYGAEHFASAAICAMVVVGIVGVVRRWRSAKAERRTRWSLAIFALVFWVLHNAWWNWNGIDYYNGLPFQICDLAGLAAPLALLTGHSWLRAILYFWGFSLSLLGFVQPTLSNGPAYLHFWLFWTAHTIIISCAAYDLTAGGWRPDWADLRRAAVASLAYLVFIMPINAMLGSNYGYVGNPDRSLPPLLMALGPWPGRVGIIIVMTAVCFILLLLPWLVLQRPRQPV